MTDSSGLAHLRLVKSCDLGISRREETIVNTNSTRRAALWLLIIPYIGLLWVPFYNFHDPVVFGFPFFYWYQLAWVPITAFLTWIAYRSTRHDD